ncbi:hypothetical protein BRC91_05750 [Halobacteriales archaeon QS_4_62_28]|nr:MAG: hypothetical protein BRC91_05750 [Halobacteriales archaeon QS_4_62_28]
MASEIDDIRDRAWVEHRRPPVTDIDEALWFAEDPVTDCAGVGRVEAEAVGNLVAVVVAYEAVDGLDQPALKLPGRTIARPSMRSTGPADSVFDRLRSFF